MKKRIPMLVVATVVLATGGFARLMPIWSYDALVAASDLVAVVEVTSIDDTAEALDGHGDSNLYQAHRAGLRTVWTIKGEPAPTEILLRYFSYSRGSGGPNGAFFISFADFATTHYLVFLKKDVDGMYVPATGHYDASFSVKRIQRTVQVHMGVERG